MVNMKNSSLNKPVITVEKLEDTDAFTLIDLNNMAYYVSNEWLDSQIAQINYEALSELNPKLVRSLLNSRESAPIKKNVRKNEKRDRTPDEAKSAQADYEIGNKPTQASNLNTDQIKPDAVTPTTTTPPPQTTTSTPQATPMPSTSTEPRLTTDANILKESKQSIEGSKQKTAAETKEESIQQKKTDSHTISIESIQTELNNLLTETLELSLQTVSSTTTSTATPPVTSTTTQSSSSTGGSGSQVPIITPVPVNGKLQTNGKDDNLTTLNNRIKILELNMSLSSQYLEKLSQHYR